jgi:hypothetical protein
MLGILLKDLEQPKDGFASSRWWEIARLRHILHNIEMYYKNRQKTMVVYQELKLKKSKKMSGLSTDIENSSLHMKTC